MGLCVSCCSRATAAPPPATAKVILRDGGLREFFEPVKAAHVLEMEVGPEWAVCDADGMDFDVRISAADFLRPGGLYFVLPAAMLLQPLQAEDLAALAIKASAALVQAAALPGGGMAAWFRRRSVAPQPLVFGEAPRPARPVGLPEKTVNRGKGRHFAPSLSIISE